MKDLKYLAAYIVPVLCLIGLLYGGLFTFAGVVFAFVLVPLLDPLLPVSDVNLEKEERVAKLSNGFFDFLLYLNLPIVYGLCALFAIKTYQGAYSFFELYGLVLSMGSLLGSNGINVGHELGNRKDKWAQFCSKALYLPEYYMHFFIEHNRGHHKHVATPLDPATSRYNEPVYTFWFRSIIGGYKSAWKLEKERLVQRGLAFWSMNNQMLVFTSIQALYVFALLFFFNVETFLVLTLAGIMGVFLLETVNYIEHYGILRKQLPSGKYERVLPKHSWNSNHELGRIILYELTRHSDHHYMASKKYQILEHYDDSPQLPYGYPTSMLMSLIPPLWFKVMNKRLDNHKVVSKEMALATH